MLFHFDNVFCVTSIIFYILELDLTQGNELHQGVVQLVLAAYDETVESVESLWTLEKISAKQWVVSGTHVSNLETRVQKLESSMDEMKCSINEIKSTVDEISKFIKTLGPSNKRYREGESSGDEEGQSKHCRSSMDGSDSLQFSSGMSRITRRASTGKSSS